MHKAMWTKVIEANGTAHYDAYCPTCGWRYEKLTLPPVQKAVETHNRKNQEHK